MSSNIESRVIEIFQSVLGRDFDQHDLDVLREETPEWNSLSHVEIVFSCEDQFQIEFSIEELSRLSSIRSFVESISDKLD
jgi:acyl carrier protein